MSTDLDLKSKRLQSMQRQTREAEERAREACSQKKVIEETANLQMKERCAEVVALLMKLLSTEEDAKELRKQVEEGRKKNEELMCKVKELWSNSDQERRKSLQMSETIALQQNDIKTFEDLTNQYQELQFNSEKLQMEKNQAVSELNELKAWAETLKARYDILEKNKQQCQENFENIVMDCSLFRKKMQELQFQLSVSQRQGEYLKGQNAELTRLVKKAINEREEARRERDELTQRYSDVLKEKDEAVRTFLQESTEFECQHELDCAEMQSLRERLIRTEEELKFLKMEKELSLKIKSSASVSDSILFLS